MGRRAPDAHGRLGRQRSSRDWAAARLDALVLAACFALFLLVAYALKPLGIPGALGGLVNGHLIDIVGGCAFCAYVNLLFDLVHPATRLRRWWQCVVLIVSCGLFWEYVAPVLVRPSVSDPLDLVSYVVGALAYAAVDAMARPRLGAQAADR